jgi:hypothetical protein
MPIRKVKAEEDQIREAMALLIHNQAAFVEQIARSDQERLALQQQNHELLREVEDLRSDHEARCRNVEEWQRKSDERFVNIEKRLIGVEERLKRIETVLLQLPQTIKKEVAPKSTS